MKKLAATAPVVLLAEDDDSYRVFCRMSFEAGGFRVLEARDGSEAIEQALDGRPAALVLDLWLPGITGREVLRILRSNKDFASVPILVVSGVPEVKDLEGLLEDGADAVFEKPFPPPDLVAATADLLRTGRSSRQVAGRRLEAAGGDA